MKTLTRNQVGWLSTIAGTGATGISLNNLLSLRGRAKNYASSYARSLRSAIDAHNAGTASNSPIPAGQFIEEGHYGPRGGRAFRLASLEPILAVAIEVLAAEAGESNGPS